MRSGVRVTARVVLTETDPRLALVDILRASVYSSSSVNNLMRKRLHTTSMDSSSSEAVVDRIARVDHVMSEALAAFYRGMTVTSGRRSDVTYQKEIQEDNAKMMRGLLRKERARPSALQPLYKFGFAALGAASGMVPVEFRNSVIAGVHESLEQNYIDQLRQLREEGLADAKKELRGLIRLLRDQDVVPEGSPRVPDITSLPEIQNLSTIEKASYLMKAGTDILVQGAKVF